jgi:hypothetical protein
MRRSQFTAFALAALLLSTACQQIQQPAAPPQSENVTVPAPAKRPWPVINGFSATDNHTLPGENVTLRWSVTDATSVAIDNGVGRVGMDGTVTVAPQKTTRFTLTAAGDRGVSTAWVNIEVAKPQTFMPDLVITGVTHISGLLYYKIKNTGAVDAGMSETWVYDHSHMPRDTSWVESLKAGEEKTLPFTNYDWEGHTITVCADGKKQVSEAGEDNNCYVPAFGFSFNYDISQMVSRAAWRGSAGRVKYGESDKVTGYAVKLTEVVAGDGQTYRNVIETVPPNSSFGWLEGYFGDWQEQWQMGGYMLPLQLPHNARFTARVGLSQEAEGSDGVTFLFGIQEENGAVNWWPGVKAYYGGELQGLDIDLSSYGGKKVMAVLRVEAGAGPDNNRALWIDPKISQ